ncbi:hypothetical protein K3N28_14650 [Glycomyces sp. TRM65418]|uniref:hypothetical protein n=1 Tax=Glycomyces sp. TRM65418 TaxID=2867006 RepID=UPI001CE659C9|nr:hypothetical protein [Glycomyces sp. TRM65418]MCC3764302.1 hypothetical protein [Glycomyces sp. TRM65418]QZD53983.1 hypothetical protein K3N28_14575 [Glycomyces sp. TRM65418]
MKRIIWVGIGIAVGVVVVRKVTKVAESVTPGGVAERVGDAGAEMKASFKAFWADVSEAKQAKEAELFDAIERGEDVTSLLGEEDDEQALNGRQY